MIKRCYAHLESSRHKTYTECEVCEEWQNFQNFAEWYDENYFNGCHIDKDIKIKGNKIYSPETCIMVTRSENMEEVLSRRFKPFKIISPDNKEFYVTNASKFARENGLSQSGLNRLSNGKTLTYKGWILGK